MHVGSVYTCVHMCIFLLNVVELFRFNLIIVSGVLFVSSSLSLWGHGFYNFFCYL